MNSLSTRLAKLESSMLNDAEPMRIGRFIVYPGNFHPRVYSCEGVDILRCHDESEESFKQRCFDSVTWLDGKSKIFEPMW